MDYKVTSSVTYAVTSRDIDTIMELAYWCKSKWCDDIECVGVYRGTWAYEQIARGGDLLFHSRHIDREHIGQWYLLALPKLLDGLSKYITYYCSRRSSSDVPLIRNDRFIAENVTEKIADEIIQTALFGEVLV